MGVGLGWRVGFIGYMCFICKEGRFTDEGSAGDEKASCSRRLVSSMQPYRRTVGAIGEIRDKETAQIAVESAVPPSDGISMLCAKSRSVNTSSGSGEKLDARLPGWRPSCPPFPA